MNQLKNLQKTAIRQRKAISNRPHLMKEKKEEASLKRDKELPTSQEMIASHVMIDLIGLIDLIDLTGLIVLISHTTDKKELISTRIVNTRRATTKMKEEDRTTKAVITKRTMRIEIGLRKEINMKAEITKAKLTSMMLVINTVRIDLSTSMKERTGKKKDRTAGKTKDKIENLATTTEKGAIATLKKDLVQMEILIQILRNMARGKNTTTNQENLKVLLPSSANGKMTPLIPLQDKKPPHRFLKKHPNPSQKLSPWNRSMSQVHHSRDQGQLGEQSEALAEEEQENDSNIVW